MPRRRQNHEADDEQQHSSPYKLFDEENPNSIHDNNNRQQQHKRNLAYEDAVVDKDNSYDTFAAGNEEMVYELKQRHGYFAIGFSLVQVIILALMMYQCGVAPMDINPMIGPFPDALSYWGGKNSFLILSEGENWRMVTPILLHAGVIHLLGNVAVQLETGTFFEREWGSFIWLIIYLVSAVGGSILSTVYMPQSVSVGSSGSVMGLFGGKLAEIMTHYCEKKKTTQAKISHKMRMKMACPVLCSVGVVMAFSFIPFVDWAAHLGGLLAGFCIGTILFAASLRTWKWSLFWGIIGICISVYFFAFYLQKMVQVDPPQELEDVCAYYGQYFQDYECTCQIEDIEWMNNNGEQDEKL